MNESRQPSNPLDYTHEEAELVSAFVRGPDAELEERVNKGYGDGVGGCIAHEEFEARAWAFIWGRRYARYCLHNDDQLAKWVNEPDRPFACCHRLIEPPVCWTLLLDPTGTLAERDRWPKHLCWSVMMALTERWASSLLSTSDSRADRWRHEWPIPVGVAALQRFSSDDDANGGANTLTPLLLFAGQEVAMVVLDIPVGENRVTFFGLGAPEPDTDAPLYQIGASRFVIRGPDPTASVVTQLADQARCWWATMEGRSLFGRPRGSGSTRTPDDISRAYRTLLVTDGMRPTQEQVAAQLYVAPRTFKDALKRFRAQGYTYPPT